MLRGSIISSYTNHHISLDPQSHYYVDPLFHHSMLNGNHADRPNVFNTSLTSLPYIANTIISPPPHPIPALMTGPRSSRRTRGWTTIASMRNERATIRPGYSPNHYGHGPGDTPGTATYREEKPGCPRQPSEWTTASAVAYARPVGRTALWRVSPLHHHGSTITAPSPREIERSERKGLAICECPERRKVLPTAPVRNFSDTGPQAGNDAVPYNQATSPPLSRIRERAGLRRRETCEVQVWDTLREFQGEVFVDSKEDALRVAQEWADQERTVWTDGSRLDNGRVGAAWAWQHNGEWKEDGIFLGTNKEVFDAEVYAICEVVNLLDRREEKEQSYVVFSDSQAAIYRVLHEEWGPAQALARATIDASRRLRARGSNVTIRWTPSHQGVAGNERADACARAAAAGDRATACPAYLREASLSHLTRLATEARSAETDRWIRQRVKRKHRYRPPPRGGRCAGSSEQFARSVQDGFTSYCRDTRPRPHTLRESARSSRTGAGGATRARDSRASTSSVAAAGGGQRIERCGEGLRSSARGAPGSPQSEDSSRTHGQLRRS